MSHKKEGHHKEEKKRKEYLPQNNASNKQTISNATQPKLEIVLKCDTTGSLEAIKAAILDTLPHQVKIEIIHSGIGTINKSDVFLAETGSHLIIGFNVDVDSKAESLMKTSNIEIRLFQIIYRLTEDIQSIASSLIPSQREIDETTFGKARVIALFKSCRRGIIIGCEIEEGNLSIGQDFRVITAMGPTYSGKIESLHIENNPVKQAQLGQQVGIKIKNFNKVHKGDLVESYQTTQSRPNKPWTPKSSVMYR